MPNAATYAQRFGSLSRAYELVGYISNRNSDFIEVNKRLQRLAA
jgi:hypothetical protein